MSDREARRRSLFGLVAELGPSAQAAIPGVYAWALTVAPAAWSRGTPVLPKVVATFGLVMLAVAAVIERRLGATEDGARPRTDQLARITSVWGLVLSSALVWALSPAPLSPFRLDSPRGVAGMLGWALFAFASAAPSLKRDPAESERFVPGAPLKPRTALPRGDLWYLLGGIALAIALQSIGWRVTTPERAVLVRLVTLAAGVGVIGAATDIALARHMAKIALPRKKRMRRALPSLLLLALVAVVGLAFSMLR
jgi:hypothetical protein